MPYETQPTVKVKSADSPDGWMLVNRADYKAGLPQWMYTDGLAYNPDDYPLYEAPAARGQAAGRQSEPDKK